MENEFNINLNISGLDPLATFYINSPKWLEYKTFITQEMLSNNFLASNVVYMSTKHNDKVLNKYENILFDIFNDISLFEKERKDIKDCLKGPICHSGFKRLN